MSTTTSGTFTQSGMLVLPGVFAGARLESLRRRAEHVQAVARQRDLATRHWFTTVPPSEQDDPRVRAAASYGIDRLERPEVLDPELLGVFADPLVDDALIELFAGRPLPRMTTLFWAPQVADYRLWWHRDLVPLALYDAVAQKPAEQDHVRFYIALRDDDALRYIPESHRRPLDELEREHADRGPEPLPHEERLELEAGDVAFFDPHIFHRAQVAAGAPRLTLLFSVQAAWVPLLPGPFADHFAWMCSGELHDRLDPVTRAYYEGLRHATTQGDPFAYLTSA